MRFVKGILFFLFLMIFSVTLPAQEGQKNPEAEKEFDPGTFILNHIADSHEWHILSKKDGKSVAVYLPVILYQKDKGLDFCFFQVILCRFVIQFTI